MSENKDKKDFGSSRRDFFVKMSLASGALVTLGHAAFASENNAAGSNSGKASGEKIKVLTPEGKLVEVEKSKITPVAVSSDDDGLRKRARAGIEGHKWVMVIDLSRCKHALKCQNACNKHHHIPGDRQWLNVYKMQDAEDSSPYWMPKTCFHCDRPPCVAVCPVDATFKREDGIVLIDNERCIGCRFCMAACPYSTRVFNWGEPNDPPEVKSQPYDPEKGLPRKKGTVEKCDFCPDMLREGKLPHCVQACPNGVFFFGDKLEDTVTNGFETYRFSKLLKDKAGYRYLEDLGTEPSVYYLPPVNRLVPFDESENYDPESDNDGGHHHH